MKYLFLSLIVFLTSCSLNKESLIGMKILLKSLLMKKTFKDIKKNGDYKSMTFDEFNLFLKDYSKNAEYPDINQ